MDTKHEIHKHESGTEHKMQRVYARQKVNQKWQYVPVGWMCPDCGQILKNGKPQ